MRTLTRKSNMRPQEPIFFRTPPRDSKKARYSEMLLTAWAQTTDRATLSHSPRKGQGGKTTNSDPGQKLSSRANSVHSCEPNFNAASPIELQLLPHQRWLSTSQETVFVTVNRCQMSIRFADFVDSWWSKMCSIFLFGGIDCVLFTFYS